MNYVSLLKQLFRLKRNEKKTIQQMKAYQAEKLSKLLSYAYHHSKYYQQVFNEAGISEDKLMNIRLKVIPVIDKDSFIKNFDELITVNDVTQNDLRRFDQEETCQTKLFMNKYHLVHSSGSTGLPAYFLYDEEAWNTMLLGIIRAAVWKMKPLQLLKLLIDKPRIMYIAATDGRYGGAMAVGDGIDGLHMKQIYLDVQSPLCEWIDKVNTFKPNIIIGYPSAIKILAELIQDGKLSVQISRVITCGEPLHSNLESMLESVFLSPVVNVYGASESLALGVGISGTEGICLFDDLNLIEIEDDKIYLTCLYNYAQPLIRYCLSDELKQLVTAEHASPFTRVRTILGRSEDLLWFTDQDGKQEFLHPLSVEGICVDGLFDYQFVKTSENSFKVCIEIDQSKEELLIKAGVQKIINQILCEKKLHWIKYQIECVNGIFPDKKTGKKKLMIA